MASFLKTQRRFLFFLILLGCGSYTVAFSQSFNEIRRCLLLRDKLTAMRSDIENLTTDDIDFNDIETREKPAIIKKNLKVFEEDVEDIKKSFKGPLGQHYLTTLTAQIAVIKTLMPAMDKRFAQAPRLPLGHQPIPASAPVEVRPVPAVAPVAIPVFTASPAVPTSRPVVSPALVNASTTEGLASGAPKITEEERLAKRKSYFHFIWPRILLTKNIFKRGTKARGNVAVGPLEPPASGSSQLIASAPAPVVLPPPVAWKPPPMTPLQPSAGPDPQVKDVPSMRPLAIMIENHNQARPQTGIIEAEVVYEIPVEGGITRFMAMFYHIPGVIGPIRSCRDYFIDRALEVNALYVHCGGSPQGYDYIEKALIFAIDEINNGTPFYRDNTRKAPHNLYSKAQSLVEYAAQKHPMELPYQRLPLLYGPNPTAGTVLNKGVSIHYHGNYTLTYRYNPQFNVYDRYMNGSQHLDRITLRPVSPGTVVIQEAAMKTIDDKGRQDISFIGQGKAFILTGGTLVNATWQKTAPREFTRYFDEKGRSVIFSNAQSVWIQVVSPQNQVTFDPPYPEEVAQATPAKK